MSVHYLETGSTDPCFNLAFEQYVLENRKTGDWLLLWQNANTVVVGLNQNTAEEINADFVEAHGITVVRRMTGGGAVYHDLGNLNYSFITDLGPAAELNIRRFTEPVCRALASLGIQAETGGRNDILVGGRKISGVAQRISGQRILHHGTLLFDSDIDMIAGALRVDPSKFQSKSTKSLRSRVGCLRDALPPETGLADFWSPILSELTASGILRETLGEEELAEIRTIAETRYRNPAWTYGRNPPFTVRNFCRFPEGSLDVRVNSREGRIADIRFFGDYLALLPCTPLAEALLGLPLDRRALAPVFDRFDTASMFGGISKKDILDLILGQNLPVAPALQL